MAKFDHRKLKAAQRKKLLDVIAEAVVTMNTKKQARQFLQHLLTSSEQAMLGRRLQIAAALLCGTSYRTIREELGVGFSTIRSTDDWLSHTIPQYQEKRSISAEQAAKEQIKAKSREAKQQRPLAIPGTLEYLVDHDSRFVLFKLLLIAFRE